ncbi:four helix bundle protein [Algibacter amylolyticus]|uniref:Four helix bundle protein n=1 Tax=Algibacter amylolyticus TaxID=1608400 RepID=A0A5M7AYL4_9FLAO|nr:four helix bundle protein [Algibacter amylolyticus]KAA5822319.1 four helix bundle protein [Algibacter amylolyticus]MBB5269034.1 four helix bundle protein [Algibacter amylolyticus]TSJ73469.1 four helix bundle protein [Algibacter amylolyticus]
MKEQLKNRTKVFAHNCIKITKSLPNTYLSNHIRGQLIRCSTSVAANYRATCIAQFKPSFIAKISIVIEEVDESNFWLDFALDENLIEKSLIENFLKESSELTAIFMASRKTASIK